MDTIAFGHLSGVPSPFPPADSPDRSLAPSPALTHDHQGSRSPTRPPHERLSHNFLEAMISQMKLTPPQAKGIHDLSSLAATFGGGIGLAEQGLALYFAASLAAMENRLMAVVNTVATLLQKSDDNDIGDLRGLFKELVIRLEDSFRFTKEQNGNIRRVTQDLIIRPTRIKFKDINIDVEAQLRTNAVMYSLDNIIGRPTRESLLTTTCKRVASGVRNSFRQDIRDSIIGPSTMSLKKFTMDMLVKYRIGNLAVHVEQPYLIFFAILRRFAYENKVLLVESEPEAEVGDGERQSSPDLEPQLDESQQSPQTGKKRKRTSKKSTKGVGRVPDGEDFWSKVDEWFDIEIQSRGNTMNFASPAWKSYVTETIARDNGRFDPSSRRDPQAASPDKSHSSTNLSFSSSEDQQALAAPQVFSQSVQSSSSLPPMSFAQGSTSFTFAAPSPSPVSMNSVSPSAGSGFSGILLAAQGY